jgi:hypothetical protein
VQIGRRGAKYVLDGVRHLLVDVVEQVAVQVARDRARGVAQALRYGRDRHAGGEQKRRVLMAESVERQMRQLGAVDQGSKRLRDVVEM